MKLVKCFRRIILFTILFASLAVILVPVESVQATVANMHAGIVLLRVETEIMQKTPAGQYYDSLFWKHVDEVNQIMDAHPEHEETLLWAIRLFIPELEALLAGRGDSVYITADHIKSLKAELDWFSTQGSLALQQDIQKEQERFPLDIFVGMTINESLDFINSTWAPDSPANKTLVPNSDGKWAYFVHNGIYFEYPSNYSVQLSGSEKDSIYFIPYQGSPEQWRPNVMKVHIWNVPAHEKEASDPHSWHSHENVLWERDVQNTEFPGVEFISGRGNSSCIDFHAFLYNQGTGLALDVWVLVTEGRQFSNDFDYSTMVDQEYEYFQHMVDNLHLSAP